MDPLRTLVTISFVVLALLGLRLWLRHRSAPTGWVTLMFLALGSARLTSHLLPDAPRGAAAVVAVAVPAVLVTFPYLLFRFAESFEPISRRWRAVALGIAVALVTATVVASWRAYPAEPPPDWYGFFVLAAVGSWTAFTAWAVWRLWSAGRRQPSVVRSRLRAMALAAGLLNAALLVAGLGEAEWQADAGELAAFASAVTFVLAFAPPRVIRSIWRRADERALWHTEGELVAAQTRAAVVEAVLPHATRLLGGQGALFIDRTGGESAVGLSPESRAAVRRRVESATGTVSSPEVTEGTAVMVLREGRIGVATTPYTPLFGRDELELMERLGILMDLALSRAVLHERERAARQRAEGVSAELEALVYGLSHDLRSPIVSVRGYVEALEEDHAARLDDEGRHFLERLRSNTDYMDQLIGDLLKLSRVGRPDDDARTVELAPVARQIADELTARYPGIAIEVGPLPAVRMGGARARQLLTNLLTNAVVHAGRPDVAVRVQPVASANGTTCVQIADNGRGIPDPYRERVFGIFETLRDGREGSPPTTGIGLAISRRIVEEAGGRIWIADSETGADVRIELPETTEAPEQVGAP